MTVVPAAMSCRDITKKFGGLMALRNVSVELREGEIVALIGPNGAGKTTLLDVLSGFGAPHVGNCTAWGTDITGLAAAERVQAGVVRTFQHRYTFATFTVLEQAELAAQTSTAEGPWGFIGYGTGSRQLSAVATQASLALGRVGLQDLASSPCANLSFGQQKLLALACAIATRAKVLLLDEPFAGVHVSIVATIMDLLRGLAREGKALLFVEHDVRAVRALADRAIVLDRGAVIANGAPRDVLARSDVVDAYLS